MTRITDRRKCCRILPVLYAWACLCRCGFAAELSAGKDTRLPELRPFNIPTGHALVPTGKTDKAQARFNNECAADMLNSPTPELRKDFAERLLLKALTDKDAAFRYLLFNEARRVAIELSDPLLTVRCIDSCGSVFSINLLAERVLAIDQLKKQVLPGNAAGRTTLVKIILITIRQAIAINSYQGAEHLAIIAQSVSRGTKPALAPILKSDAESALKDVKKCKHRWREVEKIARQLKPVPTDPNTSTLLGTYYCFVNGNWKDGLPLLKKSDDPNIKLLAKREAEIPTSPEDQFHLGDLWWDLADTLEGIEQDNVRLRAVEWYKKAQHTRTGFTKLRLQDRIELAECY